MRKKFILIGILLFACLPVVRAQEIYKNENMPVNERILDLLSRLTVEEKISLLRATSPGIPRLDIPKYYHGNEALHGVVRPGRFTVFPQAIGLASTWNRRNEWQPLYPMKHVPAGMNSTRDGDRKNNSVTC